MLYTIKSKKNLRDLIQIFEAEGMKFTHKDNYLLEVYTETEEEFDIFSNILSFYISHINFDESLTKAYINKGLSKKEAERYTKDSLYELTYSNYFHTFTRVLIKEYFKNMNTLNVESFSLFNMKGFKEEVKLFAENMIQAINENKNEKDVFEKEEDVQADYMNNLFLMLRERMLESGLNIENFNELHIYQEEKYLFFKNKKGLLLDDDFFLEYLGSELELQVVDEVDNPEIFKGTVISSILIHIFEVDKVVIHQSVSEEANEMLLFNILSLEQEIGKRIKVVMCSGCNQCK